MAAPDPFAGQFTAADWRELCRNFSPNGAAMFSAKSGEAGLVGDVPVAKCIPALRFMLGWQNVSAGPSVRLQRTPPAAHPKYSRLICVSAADEEYAPEPDVAGTVKRPADDPQGAARGLVNRTRYKKSRITARFAPVQFFVLADETVDNREWERWTIFNMEPRSEVLSLAGFQQIYTEGTGTVAPVSSPEGKAFPAEVGMVVVKSDLQVIWDLVPERYFMTTDTLRPKKILDGLGCVNSRNWNGYLAGTLLLNGVKFTRHVWSLAAGTEDVFVYTIEFLMSFFDPEKGFTGNPPTQLNRVDGTGEPTDVRGHNTFPWRGNFQIGDLNAGKWFAASYNGDSTGSRLFKPYNFANLFDSPQNPLI